MSARSPRGQVSSRSLLARSRWLLARRLCQLGLLALFLIGPLLGVWIIKGNLSASLLFDQIPLTDPLLLLQTLAAGHWPYVTAWTGALIVLVFYALVGGRVFCSWVCPVNLVTDTAAWLRRRLGIKTGRTPDGNTRYWLLAGLMAATVLTGVLVWEWVNPVTLLHRALVFGLGGASLLIIGIFLYDTLIASRGWCGHLCPVGAFYAVLGRIALVRVSAHRRDACDDCMECFVICPEPQVIRPALKGVGQPHPLILSGNCTNCGRCIDVCDRDVFKMTHRFDQRSAQ
ncbi:quinol dehydrogenase ferredoxin subunit NapH [Propionivibrio dicarboxylicus]|uniref:Ferredoxin-type protein NapH n=1 Tax=Propionivibrio dicarboxylicus TaxID=83767 RepID=A0A1G8CXS4_9RHOO|nr:quinol dehydrogenase ferredoxin subunit NapH [Propionivibrio dicarboxylicus]SDH50255.1 ferredoxin-type protein NapH [Propionivibrio dicarboxylicus]